MTFDAFIEKYEGKTWGYPNDSDYRGECLSLSKHHIKEVYGINPPASGCNGARCYWSIFPNPLGTVLKKVACDSGVIPKRGWIVVWNGNTGGGYGHIASILSATKTEFVSLDQNWNGRHAHRVNHNYSNVYGYLVPLNEPEGENMSDLKACLEAHTTLMDKINKLEKENDDLTKKIVTYEEKLKVTEQNWAECQKALEYCQAQTPQIPDNEENEELDGRQFTTFQYNSQGQKISENRKNYKVIKE